MPRVKRFQVLLNDPKKTYVSGDTISGRVIVEIVEKPLELRAIRVTFKGKGKVQWDEVSGDEVKERKRKEIYFRHLVTVFGRGACPILPALGWFVSAYTAAALAR